MIPIGINKWSDIYSAWYKLKSRQNPPPKKVAALMFRLWLFLLTLIFSTASLGEPLYWQAKKGKLTYLILGSVHVGDESMYPISATITDWLKSSDGLIVEADIRKTDGVKYPVAERLTKQVLNEKQQHELKGLANLFELNFEYLMQSPPWATALAIQMKQFEYLGYQPNFGIDAHLIESATLAKVPVIGLESIQFQIDLLTGQKESGKELLINAIDEFDHAEDATRCLIESWKAGDLNKLKQFAKLTKISPQFEQVFITQRNLNWAKQLAHPPWSSKKKGTYLVVVGALHLVGEQSVLNLLQEQGFKVTQLSKSSESNCEFRY